MAPVPKRKLSRARQGKRRATKTLRVPAFTVCPQCGGPVLSHTACAQCGSYRPDTTHENIR